jgi:hypothetical protein
MARILREPFCSVGLSEANDPDVKENPPSPIKYLSWQAPMLLEGKH